MKTVSLEQLHFLKALIYGDSGSGKTRLLGTAMQDARSCPVLHLDARGQAISLRFLGTPPLVLSLDEVTDLNTPYSWLTAGQPWEWIEQTAKAPTQDSGFAVAVLRYMEKYDQKGEWNHKFRTLVVDSITQVQRLSMKKVTNQAFLKPGDIPQQTSQPEWGRVLSQLTNIADVLYQIQGIHVLLSALTRHNEIQAYGLTMYYPFMWGQSNLEVPSYAELVGRLVPIETMQQRQVDALQKGMPDEFEGAVNALLCKGGRTFMAKWQGLNNEPPAVVLSPNMTKLLDILERG